MPETRDVVIIGGGHNGLVTAFYLAKSGFKPLVLERRAQAGAPPSPKSSTPAFAVQLWPTAQAHCDAMLRGTCNWRSTGCNCSPLKLP